MAHQNKEARGSVRSVISAGISLIFGLFLLGFWWLSFGQAQLPQLLDQGLAAPSSITILVFPAVASFLAISGGLKFIRSLGALMRQRRSAQVIGGSPSSNLLSGQESASLNGEAGAQEARSRLSFGTVLGLLGLASFIVGMVGLSLGWRPALLGVSIAPEYLLAGGFVAVFLAPRLFGRRSKPR